MINQLKQLVGVSLGSFVENKQTHKQKIGSYNNVGEQKTGFRVCARRILDYPSVTLTRYFLHSDTDTLAVCV